MNLVSSCGWLEYLADSPLADFYAPVIEDTGRRIVSTICILEVCKRMLPQRGEDVALQVAAVMHQGQVASWDADIALSAVESVRLGSRQVDKFQDTPFTTSSPEQRVRR